MSAQSVSLYTKDLLIIGEDDSCNMDIPTRLRINCVELISNLRQQEYICSYLYQQEIFTQSVIEDVLSKPTNSKEQSFVDND